MRVLSVRRQTRRTYLLRSVHIGTYLHGISVSSHAKGTLFEYSQPQEHQLNVLLPLVSLSVLRCDRNKEKREEEAEEEEGFGFIDMGGVTVFVHSSDCEPGKQPKEGDVLTFNYEPRKNNPEQMQARSVKGCSAARTDVWGQPAFAGPVEGTGAYTGSVKNFGSKGYGFIVMEDGVEMFFNIKDCVGSKPVAGDTVKFDIEESPIKPGSKQAKNVTGGSQPLDPPMGMKGGWGPMWDGGKGWGGGWGWNGGWDGGKGAWGGGKGGLKGGMMAAGPYGKGGKGEARVRDNCICWPEGIARMLAIAAQGFGFIDMGGVTVFVHNTDCEPGKQPKEGDVLTFNYEPRKNNPEQMQARNVKGCSAARTDVWGQPKFAGPVEGTGAYTGSVKSFGAKGYGFIVMEDGVEMFFNIKDCVGSKPMAGDTVKFDIEESPIKPGSKQAKNVTGGSQPLDPPMGMKGGWGPMWDGGKGMWGGGGGGGWGWDGGKGAWGGGGGKGGLKGGMMAAGPYGKGDALVLAHPVAVQVVLGPELGTKSALLLIWLRLCVLEASPARQEAGIEQDLSKRVQTRLLDICDLSTPLPPADVVVAAVLYDARTAKAMAERVAEAHLRGSVGLFSAVVSRVLRFEPELCPGFDFPIEGLAVQETDGAEVEHRHVPVQSVLNSQYRAQILALQWLCQLRIVHGLMAPKKSAKRVIQVPEEDEPPAKKLLTSLKRHGIKESTYRHVADVFSHSAAAHLSQDCKDMFMAALPFSLLMASDERNTFQETVVGLVDKVLTEMLAGMQESLDKANEKLQLMDAEKARLDEAIQLAEDQLKAAQACACEKRAVVTAASAAVSAAQEKLSAAKEAEAAGQRARQAASDDKAMLQQAVSTGCFSRLKAGEWEDGEAERLFSSLEPLVLKKLKTDSSLRTAMRCTLLKKPVNRGQFDAMLLEELERAFSARISELESNLSEEGAVTAELAENVATANAEVETAMASQQQASAALSSSSSEEKMRAAALQAAKVTLQEFKPKHAQACSGRNAEQQQMQQFVDKNVAAFQELKDRVSIKSEKEMATGKELQANPTSALGCEAGPEVGGA
ncbi:hypothetical protein AK812_SmicGene8738 [Symbiodinium microadriaticum]|uniref:CSD domain-containing protein n=1 Tax=Symbiodinium microadriaticum TaxID=2951 RepID=A0A1Q9EKC0_SYMMI|nr:hypothetical protein AK812_SmicGene8738 [Symbiodinium microadriaticum]